jgi:hypothetical protein
MVQFTLTTWPNPVYTGTLCRLGYRDECHFQQYFRYIVVVSLICRGNHRSVASHWQTWSHMTLYRVHFARAWFELTTLVATGTDCICCISLTTMSSRWPTESCVNWTLNKPESCVNWTLNTPESCVNWTLNTPESCVNWTLNTPEVSDLRQIGGFLYKSNRRPRYNGNIVESGIHPCTLTYTGFQYIQGLAR